MSTTTKPQVSMEITIIDAGTGNIRSVSKAFERLGALVTITSEPREILAAPKAVLPGVGAFGDFMQGLRRLSLETVIRDYSASGRPLLGICVGMQALFDFSSEYGEHRGLGIVKGQVVRFPGDMGVKIPQTGWNQLIIRKPASLFKNIQNEAYVYFNHAYFCIPEESDVIIASTNYGISFASAINLYNVSGVQFHPEKSQQVGLKLLNNFLASSKS
jgi:imidazole glycerol-phosphate synthase subunit HisH